MHYTTTPLLKAALRYWRRGYHPIPLIGKKAAIPWAEYRRRQPTKNEIRAWFSDEKITGIGLVLGPGGVAARDFDSRESYHEFRHQNPALRLPTSQTRRGRHVFFRAESVKTEKFSDGELRGDGAYVVVPPSFHPSGVRYKWDQPLPKLRYLPVVSRERFSRGQEKATDEAEKQKPFALPLRYSTSSTDANAEIERVVSSTQPEKGSERNFCIFSLARGLKINCGIRFKKCKKIVREWHRRALPIIKTKDFDETWADFVHAYANARHALGANIVDQAALLVDPDELPEAAKKYSSEGVQKLVSLCFHLAKKNQNDGKFFISSYDVARRLNIPPLKAWRWIKMLCADGILQVLEVGNQHRASRYRFIIDSSKRHK